MTADQIAAFCLQLPGAREDLKWGSNRVFSVADNKMFAILDFVDKDGGLAFKVGSELFLGYVDRPGIRPAPYLARALDRHGPPLPDEGGGVARGPGPFPSVGGGAPAQAPAPRPGTRRMSRDRLYTWAGLWRSPSSSWEALRLEDDQAESQLRAPDERSGLPYQLDYRLRWDADWHLREAVFHVESETGVRKLHLLADGRGHWQDGDGEALPAFDGCLDIDIWPSPFTNTFPIRRLGLADGQRAEIRALYIEAPALEPRSMRQAYTRLDASHYLYENLEGSAFKAVLLVDEQGLVIDYPGLFQRL